MSDYESEYQTARRQAERLGTYTATGQKEPDKLKDEIRQQHKIMRGVILQKSKENKKRLNWVMQAKTTQERLERAKEVGIT